MPVRRNRVPFTVSGSKLCRYGRVVRGRSSGRLHITGGERLHLVKNGLPLCMQKTGERAHVHASDGTKATCGRCLRIVRHAAGRTGKLFHGGARGTKGRGRLTESLSFSGIGLGVRANSRRKKSKARRSYKRGRR